MAKLVNSFIAQIETLMTPFERSLSKLSENQKLDHDTQVMAAERILDHEINY